MYEQYMDAKYVMYLEWNTYLIGQFKGMEYIHEQVCNVHH